MADLVASRRIHHKTAIRTITVFPFQNDYQIITGGDDSTLYVCESSLARGQAWVSTPDPVTQLFMTPAKTMVGLYTSGFPFLMEKFFKPSHDEWELDIPNHAQLCLLTPKLYAAIHPWSGITVIDSDDPEDVAFTIPEDACHIARQGEGRLLVVNQAAQLVTWNVFTMLAERGTEGCHTLKNVCLLAAIQDSHAAIVDAEDKTTLRILPLPFMDVPYHTVACEEIITQLITSGPYSIIGTKEGSVLLYNSETDTLVRTKNHHACITALHVLPDGRIASGDEKGHLKIIALNHM